MKIEDEAKKAWCRGFATACSITLRNHRCDTIVEDTFRCNYMSVAYMRKIGIDEFDIKILTPIVKEINRKRKFNNTK